MNIREFSFATSVEQQMEVVLRAGLHWGYWEAMKALRSRPSIELARRIIEAAKEVAPEAPLTLDEMLIPLHVMKHQHVEERVAALDEYKKGAA